jgi:xylulokinase
MSIAGLDVGTTVCRLIAVDDEGNVRATAYSEYPLITKGSRLEIDPNQLWRSVCEVCAEVSQKMSNDPIETLAVSAMGDTLITTDWHFNPDRNAILAFDSRSKAQCARLIDHFGVSSLFEHTGVPAHPMSTATKIAWVIDNAKSKQELPARYMCAEDFVIARFTGNPVMSWSSAARTMMYDVTKKEWWKELMDYLEIREDMVSHTLPSAEVVGRISAGVREELGFSRNVLIATGGHDQICGAIGSGAVMDGIVADNTGTFECVLACVGDERRRTVDRALLMNNGLALYPHGPRDAWAVLALFNAGSIVKWCRDNLFIHEADRAQKSGGDVYDSMFAALDEKPTEILLLPHFSGTGTPWLDPEATGVFYGIHLSTDRHDLLKAAIQGICFDLAINLQILEEAGIAVTRLRATGGGTRSPKWLQLKADITGKEVTVVKNSEGSALGAATCAGVAGKKYSSIEEGARRLVLLGDTYAPDQKRVQYYRDALKQYRDLYTAISMYRKQKNASLRRL